MRREGFSPDQAAFREDENEDEGGNIPAGVVYHYRRSSLLRCF